MRRYAVAGLALLAVALGWHAYWFRRHEISSNPSDWAAFGEYLGGVLSPALAFLTILLLVQSLQEQSKANNILANEIEASGLEGRRRSFEGLFFEILRSMRESFARLSVHSEPPDTTRGVGVVEQLEDRVAEICEAGDLSACADLVREHLEWADEDDRLYSSVRSFSVAAQLISQQLTDEAGFDEDERGKYYGLLLGVADFAHVRLVLIFMQFSDVKHAELLRKNRELLNRMYDVGLLAHQYRSGQKLGGRGLYDGESSPRRRRARSKKVQKGA